MKTQNYIVLENKYKCLKSWISLYLFVQESYVLPLHFTIFYYSRWLCNPQIDTKTRKWAIEGLAYLTNDADVKDDFVEDEPAMKAMFELAKVWNET